MTSPASLSVVSRAGVASRKALASNTRPAQRNALALRRLLEFDLLSHDERDALERVYRNLNPVQLKRQLDAALEALWNTADLHPDRLRSVTATNDATYTPR